MPVQQGTEMKDGVKYHYYKWGDNGKKYYFKTSKGETAAYNKAARQGRAIERAKNKK